MRANLGFLGFMLAATTAAIGFSACGTTVTEIGTTGTGGGSGGNGGAGGQSSTTVTASSTSGNMTTSSVSSSSSTSGGDDCQMACSHIQMCTGIDACNQGFNFDCTNPQYDCAAKCINNLSCSDLTLQSGQACLQQCAPQDAGPPVDAGDPCMNACAHIQQCFGFDVCAQLGMQLDCSNPQYSCIADCINSKSCMQISFQTFQTCQSQCQATGMDGGSGTTDGGTTSDAGMGSAQACQQCTQQGCFQALGTCFQTPTCASTNPQNQTWLSCALACNQQNPTPACYKACDAQYPMAASGYQAVYACECQKCGSQCGSISDPCGAH